MSAYISLAPIIERTAELNASALPSAPQLDETITFRRTRSLAARRSPRDGAPAVAGRRTTGAPGPTPPRGRLNADGAAVRS